MLAYLAVDYGGRFICITAIPIIFIVICWFIGGGQVEASANREGVIMNLKKPPQALPEKDELSPTEVSKDV